MSRITSETINIEKNALTEVARTEHRKHGNSGDGGAGHRTTRAWKPTYNVGLIDEGKAAHRYAAHKR